jgi:hypothetical protein
MMGFIKTLIEIGKQLLKSVGLIFPLVLDEMDQYRPTYILSIKYETINKIYVCKIEQWK